MYRRQTPYYWPSQNHSPENSEYVIYLYKRSLRNKQKHGLEEYELVRGDVQNHRSLYSSSNSTTCVPSSADDLSRTHTRSLWRVFTGGA